MTDILLFLGSETERNVLPTLSQLSDNDIDNIWGNVCAFVSRHMTLQKGVHITGLGTFTFSQQKMNIGTKCVVIRRPSFILAEKVAQAHGLKQTRPMAPAGDVQVVQLNFTALSVESPYDRDTVEGCVRETILVLLRALSTQSAVSFTFRGIGVLSVVDNKVRMKFYKDFVSSVNASGKLLWALSNTSRANSSLLSRAGSRCTLRVSRSATPLPRIANGGEGASKDAQETGEDPGCSVTSPGPVGAEQTQEQTQETLGTLQPEPSLPEPSPPETSPPETSQPQASRTLQPAKATGVSFTEDMDITPPAELTRRSTPFPLSPVVVDGESRRCETYVSRTCKDHTRAGQELCYLCMQRSQRNIPVYLVEERRQAEEEENRVMLLREQERIQQYLQKEQVNRFAIRENAQKTAAFNLGVTEALKDVQRPPYHGSYVFSGRPLTPHRIIKQRSYMLDLEAQTKRTAERNLNSAEHSNLLDRLHQTQLAQDIALQKSQQLLQKDRSIQSYQRALDTQVKLSHGSKGVKFPPIQRKDNQSHSSVQVAECCGSEIPEYRPNGVIFGLLDRSPSGLAEERQRAEKVFQEQLTTATQKRREELYNQRQKEKAEREMLQRNRKALIEERVERFKSMNGYRSSLEETWGRSAEVKRQRDREEKSFIRSGDQLLLEQCEQYRRCYQCKKKTSNCGQTNLWKETRYIPGSRLMI